MIEAINLTKRFGDTPAVSSLDFKVNRGEIFGIVGPDGAGKSTLLRLIAAILTPTEGSIRINGLDAFENPYLVKENLAYMPQRFGLYEDLTVEENILFFGRIFGIPRKEIKKRMKRLYEFSRLGPFSGRLAGKLSGGMKQKLGLACCLVHAPSLILLDEPTNGVDPVSRREFWKILYDLLKEEVTIVVSTAYLDEAERCNRIGLMYRGSFIIMGNPKEIKSSVGRIFIEVFADNPRAAIDVLEHVDAYRDVVITGNTLKLFVDDAPSAQREIKRILKRKGIGVISIRETVPGLEDSFVEIIARGVKA